MTNKEKKAQRAVVIAMVRSWRKQFLDADEQCRGYALGAMMISVRLLLFWDADKFTTSPAYNKICDWITSWGRTLKDAKHFNATRQAWRITADLADKVGKTPPAASKSTPATSQTRTGSASVTVFDEFPPPHVFIPPFPPDQPGNGRDAT